MSHDNGVESSDNEDDIIVRNYSDTIKKHDTFRRFIESKANDPDEIRKH